MNHLLLGGDVIAHHATVTWTYNTWTYWTYWLLLIGQNYRFIHHWSLKSDWFHLIFGLFLCSCVLSFLALCSLRTASSRHAQVETVITDWLRSNCCVTITFHLPFLFMQPITSLLTSLLTSHQRLFDNFNLLSCFYWCR